MLRFEISFKDDTRLFFALKVVSQCILELG